MVQPWFNRVYLGSRVGGRVWEAGNVYSLSAECYGVEGKAENDERMSR